MKKIILIVLSLMVAVNLTGNYGLTVNASAFPNSDEPIIVMKVNGEEIAASLLASYMAYLKPQFEADYVKQHGDSTNIWKNPVYQQLIIQGAVDQIKYEKVVPLIMRNLNLEFADQDKKMLQDTIDTQIRVCGGEDKYKEYLAQIGQTEKSYKKNLRIALCINKIQEYLYGDNGVNKVTEDKVRDYYTKKYCRVKQIFISKTDMEGNTLTRWQMQEKRELAEEIRERLHKGEAFDALMFSYGEDGGAVTYPEGYTFKKDDKLLPEFVEAAFSLAESACSDIVESEAGWHIMKRLPLHMDILREPQGSLTKSCIYDEIYADLTDIKTYMESYMDKLEIVKLDAFQDVTIGNYEMYLQKPSQ